MWMATSYTKTDLLGEESEWILWADDFNTEEENDYGRRIRMNFVSGGQIDLNSMSSQ